MSSLWGRRLDFWDTWVSLLYGRPTRWFHPLFIFYFEYIEPITNLTANDNVKYGSQTYHFPSAWMEKDGRICGVDCRENDDEGKKDFAHFVNLRRWVAFLQVSEIWRFAASFIPFGHFSGALRIGETEIKRPMNKERRGLLRSCGLHSEMSGATFHWYVDLTSYWVIPL